MVNENSKRIQGVRYRTDQVRNMTKEQFIADNLTGRMAHQNMSEEDASKVLSSVWEQCQPEPKTEVTPAPVNTPVVLTREELEANVKEAEKALALAGKANKGKGANADTEKAVEAATAALVAAKTALVDHKVAL